MNRSLLQQGLLLCLFLPVGTPCRGAETRDPALWPFSADSPWNTPIGAGARFEDESGRCTRDVRDPKSVAWINAAEWSHPVYVARESDPVVGIYLKGELAVRVHVPRDARPAAPAEKDSDAHLHIIDPTHHYVDEMWHARPRHGGGFHCDGYTRNDLYGPGIGTGGERAYGGSALGGLIRRGELAGGIHHALAFAQASEKQRLGFVWPASAQDVNAREGYRGHVPMGQLVALPPSVDVAQLDLSPAGLSIARALQDYGAYDIDTSTDFSLTAEPALEPELEPARSDLPKIRALLRCVLNNRKDSVGGGGQRRAPPAPPLAAGKTAP